MITRNEIEIFTSDFVAELIQYIRDNHNKSFSCFLKMDWSPRRICSRGGNYTRGIGINIAMLQSVKFNTSFKNPNLLTEYTSFKTDPVIGEFWSHTWQLILKTDITHEVAHAWGAFTKDAMNHGTQWKRKYAILRREFINPYIDEDLNKKIRQPGTEEYKRVVKLTTLDKRLTVSESHTCYLEKCASVGLTPDHLNKWFTIGVREYKIMGWNKKARTNFLKIERDDGKAFVTSPMMIKISPRRDMVSLKAAGKTK